MRCKSYYYLRNSDLRKQGLTQQGQHFIHRNRPAAGLLALVGTDMMINFGCRRWSEHGMKGALCGPMEEVVRPEGVRPPTV